MNTKYDVYITFSEELVKTDAKLHTLINATIDHLKISLNRVMKRVVSMAAKGIDFSDDSYGKYLSQSAVTVLFTHPDIPSESKYAAELNEIAAYFKLESINNTSGPSRVFKICPEPSKALLKPVCLDELLSYDFYEKNIYNKKVRSFDFTSADKSAAIYSKLLDLVYDISMVLNQESRVDITNENRNRNIYLGLTTFDQLQSRDDLRRELQHYGYRVLPQFTMPLTGEEFEIALVSCLRQADTAIELMGSQYGDIMKGTKYSLPDLQNRIIREYQQSNEASMLQRYIWIPLDNKISDQRQALYLKRLRRDDASENTEIIESPIETFKTILSAKLQSTNHSPRVQSENISKVYLLTEEELTKETEELYSVLSLSGLKVVTLDYAEQTGIYARHLQALRDADAVVIFQQSKSVHWLNSKLRDVIKAPGIGKLLPFKKVVVASNLTPEKHLIRLLKTKVEILTESETDAEKIVQKLILE